jgi:hypothetical protein
VIDEIIGECCECGSPCTERDLVGNALESDGLGDWPKLWCGNCINRALQEEDMDENVNEVCEDSGDCEESVKKPQSAHETIERLLVVAKRKRDAAQARVESLEALLEKMDRDGAIEQSLNLIRGLNIYL